MTGAPVPRIAAVILAAGRSERMGAPKLLLPIPPESGRPLLAHILDEVTAGPFAQVIVVLGYLAEEMKKVCAGRDVTVAVNRSWAEGMSTSVQAGLNALSPELQAAIFVLADQPGLTTRLLERLAATYAETRAPIVAPEYKGLMANPVLFDRSLFQALATQTGDKGGRALLDAYEHQTATVPIADPREIQDLDTAEDYQEWLAATKRRPPTVTPREPNHGNGH